MASAELLRLSRGRRSAPASLSAHLAMPSSLTTINGRSLFVEVSGTGPPLVSLHGLGGSTNLFPIAEDLSTSFTVIRFDFEGAGKSPLSSDGLSVKKFVEDVKAVLSFAGFEGTPAVLFGHSLGAAVRSTSQSGKSRS